MKQDTESRLRAERIETLIQEVSTFSDNYARETAVELWIFQQILPDIERYMKLRNM